MNKASTGAIRELIHQASALEKSGDMAQALALARRAFEEAAGSDVLQASASSCCAYLQNHLGNFDEALDWAQRAVDLAVEDPATRAEALLTRGLCLSDLGRWKETDSSLQEAMALARESGSHHTLQRCLHVLSAGVYIPRGDFELALAADRESLEMAEELGLEDQFWFPLVTMGWVYFIQGKMKAAEEMLSRLKDAVQPWSLAEGYYFSLAGDLAQDGPTPARAPEFYARARSIADIIGDPGLSAELRVGLSRFHRRFGSLATALSWARDALNISDTAHSSPTVGWALLELARCLLELGRHEEARKILDRAEKHSRKMGAEFDLVRVLLLKATLHLACRESCAEKIWIEALDQLHEGAYDFLLERERSLVFPLIKAFSGSESSQGGAGSAKALRLLEALPPPPIQVHCLGNFEVYRNHHLISSKQLERRRSGELLRLLLISPRHSLETVEAAEALWPEKTPQRSLASLHQASSTLRRILEPELPDKFPSRYLRIQQGRMHLDLPPGSMVDFEEFSHAFDHGDLRRALELYEGDLLSSGETGERYILLRESLRQKAIRAAILIAHEEHQRGRHELALEACLKALRLESWQEQAVLLGMKSLMAMHQRAAAIRLYQGLEKILDEELGVAPGREVRDYYASILSG